MSATVECEMAGTIPCSIATCTRLRVDQWVMCSPRPSGSQHASISTPTRWRGGKRPGPPVAGSVLDDLHPYLFVAAAEVPDRRARDAEALCDVLHDGRRIRHRQQDPCAPCDALLGASIMEELLQV